VYDAAHVEFEHCRLSGRVAGKMQRRKPNHRIAQACEPLGRTPCGHDVVGRHSKGGQCDRAPHMELGRGVGLAERL